MTPQTYMFFGRSGSGKGTQAKLLIDFLQKKDQKNKVVYIETGAKFREFAQEVGLTAQLVAKTMNEGGLLPSFLPIWVWTNIFVRNLSGNEHLILDGLSRRTYEAPILTDALKYYNREKPHVIVVNVSREWSKHKLLNRNRYDDNNKDIDARLDWYEKNVLPTIEYFKNEPYYTVVEVNGEQAIEKVHEDILAALKFS
jgi:adenylate kinase family enzyme